MFSQTVSRVSALTDFEALIIVANIRHEREILANLATLQRPATLILEPAGRESSAAIAAAAVLVHEMDPGAIAIVAPSDHYIPNLDAFQHAVDTAVVAADRGAIVTFGLTPASPATAYGYILPAASGLPSHPVARFAEKPDEATARRYIEEGYLWNSGIFVAKASVLIGELEAHVPQVSAAAREAIDTAAVTANVIRLGAAFERAPKISFDYGVMERTARAEVVATDMAWSDLGAWDAVWAAAEKDDSGNATIGDAVTFASRNSYVHSSGEILVTAVGVQNLAIVAEHDAILVCDLGRAQQVKGLVERLTAQGRPEIDFKAGTGLRASWPDAAGLWSWADLGALPLWWAMGADHAHGGFFAGLADDGQPVDEPRSCAVQAGQVIAFATAGRAGWRGPWRQAVEHGLLALDRDHLGADGLYRGLAGDRDAPLPRLEDQALVLKALAAAEPGRGNLETSAHELITRLDSWGAGDGPGYRAPGETRLQTGPNLLLLDAALSWLDAGGGARWAALAGALVELCGTWFGGPYGGLAETLGETGAGAVLPGRQFQAAGLLARWARWAGDAVALSIAKQLFAVGRAGAGGVVEAGDAGLAAADSDMRIWAKAEWVKAAVQLGDPGQAAAAAHALARHLSVPVPGLWRESLAPGPAIAHAAPFWRLIEAVSQLNPRHLSRGPHTQIAGAVAPLPGAV